MFCSKREACSEHKVLVTIKEYEHEVLVIIKEYEREVVVIKKSTSAKF